MWGAEVGPWLALGLSTVAAGALGSSELHTEPGASPERGPELGASPAFQWRRGRTRRWEPPSLEMALPSRPPGVWGDRYPHRSEATPVPQKMSQNLQDLYRRSLQGQVERWQRDTGLSELKPPKACGHFLTRDYELPAPLLPRHDLRMFQLYPLRGPKQLTSALWNPEQRLCPQPPPGSRGH